MNARPGWTPQKQEFYDLASEAEDEPVTEREIAVAMREQLDMLIKAIDRPSGDRCETCDLWVDIVANAVEGREQARIRAMD
jgi:hypothetical protein